MVYFKELLPNPAGKDTVGELITLFNDGSETIGLQGWVIKDASGKKFIFGDQTILPNQELKLPYSLTRINLNNDGDTLALWNAAGEKVDELNYGQVGEEEIVSSSKITPPAETGQLIDASPLAAKAFTGQVISPEVINPLLIALGLALAFGIGTAILTKKLIDS
ncbi:MAG: lamin tail domain-containing protein [Candidatus Colwellbacteria bacterium]|nr:lamin tail domain-containing protein [Candidatus Colwellbacteria bacterium]